MIDASSDLDDYYRDVAGRFDAIRLDREQEIDNVVRRVSSLVDRGERILEIGSGTARHSAALQRLGLKVVAVDKRLNVLGHAPRDLLRVCGLGETLPFASRSFSACLMILVVHQIAKPDRPAVFSESWRVMLPGGHLLIKTTAPEDLHKRSFVRYFPAGLELNLKRYPSLEEIRLLAEHAGYQFVSSRDIHTSETLSVSDVLRAVKGKHNSTLALLPEVDFRSGCARLESDLRSLSQYRVDHYHSLLLFGVPGG